MISAKTSISFRNISSLLTATALLLLVFSGSATAVKFTEAKNVSSVYPGETWERIKDPSSAGYSIQKLEKVREYVKTLDTTGLIVVVGGKVLFEYGDLKELSYLASVRKSILAILYGKYVTDGTIRLNTTLEELGITDKEGLLPVERKATIDHLITARSGIYHPASNAGDSTAYAPQRGSQQPGDYFLYNNWDFNCAGYIFEMLTRQVIYDTLEHDLAVPLGMQDFDRLRQRKSGNLKRSRFPAYHIWLSTRDMARIGYLMLREGEWNGRQIIPQVWARKISRIKTPLERMNPEPYRKSSFGYGYMWWIWDGPNAVGHYKGGYTARGAYGQYITVLPAMDMVIAHKTAVPPRKRSVRSNQYMGIIERLIAARTESRNP
ncbi:MAG: serine hydrolase [Candidatus Aminicenantes bacterium]|nr:MAG: serine hydrolase [Candidatus Aminicenantes bacterium]